MKGPVYKCSESCLKCSESCLKILQNPSKILPVKPFLTSKGFLHIEDTAINFDNRTITDEKELSKIFNKYHINIVQNTTGTAPVKISSKYEW